MKLRINFDLIKKINEANCGFSLENCCKRTLIYTSISSAIALTYTKPENMMQPLWFFLSLHSINSIVTELALAGIKKSKAIDQLKLLTILLKKIDINTNYEMILNSYKYKTEYEKDNDSYNLNQKKYIMIPVIQNGEEREISILQEHIIGSKEYIISHGEPQKILRLALNPA